MKFTSCQSTSVKMKSLWGDRLPQWRQPGSLAVQGVSTGNRGVLWTINFGMLICDHLSWFFVLFLQSIEFRFDFMLFSESNTMKERRRAWIALHLHLNHGPDRKPEGEPSFIMNAVLQSRPSRRAFWQNRPSNVRIFVILPVFLWFSARSER